MSRTAGVPPIPLPPQCQVVVVEPPKSVPSKGTLVFIHGWPDTVKLWEPTQERFAALGYRCAAVGLPGYGTGQKKQSGFTFAEADELIQQAVAHVAQGQRIKTLIGHDWGSLFVSRIERSSMNQMVDKYVKLDVGEGFDPSLIGILAILVYQIPAALAFLIGGRVGGWITKTLTSLIKAPAPPDDSSVNWPYPDFLRSVITGAPLIPGKRPAADQLKPMLYIWGEEKPVQFHSRKWMNAVSRRTDGSRVLSMKGGHWFIVRKKTREEFWRHLQAFIEDTPAPSGAADAAGSKL